VRDLLLYAKDLLLHAKHLSVGAKQAEIGSVGACVVPGVARNPESENPGANGDMLGTTNAADECRIDKRPPATWPDLKLFRIFRVISELRQVFSASKPLSKLNIFWQKNTFFQAISNA
jgi:hypothetical protein